MTCVKILDCETEDTAYTSLENITGISKQKFIDFFNCFDMDKYYDEVDYNGTGDQLLFEKLLEMTKGKDLSYDGTMWFHLSRTTKSEVFYQGILPLGQVINSLWYFLFTLQEGILTKKQWNLFRESLTNSDEDYAFLYSMKISDSFHWGPYAMLIREIAFAAKDAGNHDYLDVPEIIEDICLPFQEKFNYDLLENFKQSTIPCIVKFQTADNEKSNLGIAMYYLYHKHKGEPLSLHSNICFDGEGKAIKDILKIETVKN